MLNISREICTDCPLQGTVKPNSAKEWAFDGEFEQAAGLPENFGRFLHPVPFADRDLALNCRSRVLLGACQFTEAKASDEEFSNYANEIARQIVKSEGRTRASLEQQLSLLPRSALLDAATALFKADSDELPGSVEERIVRARAKSVLTRGFTNEDYATIWEKIRPSD